MQTTVKSSFSAVFTLRLGLGPSLGWAFIRELILHRSNHFIRFYGFVADVSDVCCVVIVQSLSRVWLSVTTWTAESQASLSLTICLNLCPASWWCHSILSCPLLLLPSVFPSIRVSSTEWALPIRWPKYWSFSFSISPSSEYSGLISFRIAWSDLLAVQGTLESSLTPQLESINPSALSLLYGPTLASLSDYWKNHSLDYMDLCWQNNVSAFYSAV